MLNGELYEGVVSVDVAMEAVQLMLGPEQQDHEYVVKEALVGSQGAETIDGLSLSLTDDFLINLAHEVVHAAQLPIAVLTSCW